MTAVAIDKLPLVDLKTEEFIVKALPSSGGRMKIGILASDESLDLDEEITAVNGLAPSLEYLERWGKYNDNHGRMIGEITKAVICRKGDLIEKGYCSDSDIPKREHDDMCLWTEGWLYPHSPAAHNYYSIIKSGGRIGGSLQGRVLQRAKLAKGGGKTIRVNAKCFVNQVAITGEPKNANTRAFILKSLDPPKTGCSSCSSCGKDGGHCLKAVISSAVSAEVARKDEVHALRKGFSSTETETLWGGGDLLVKGLSFNQISNAVYAALNPPSKSEAGECVKAPSSYAYVRDIYPDGWALIEKNGKTFKADWEIDGDKVKLGELQECELVPRVLKKSFSIEKAISHKSPDLPAGTGANHIGSIDWGGGDKSHFYHASDPKAAQEAIAKHTGGTKSSMSSAGHSDENLRHNFHHTVKVGGVTHHIFADKKTAKHVMKGWAKPHKPGLDLSKLAPAGAGLKKAFCAGSGIVGEHGEGSSAVREQSLEPAKRRKKKVAKSLGTDGPMPLRLLMKSCGVLNVAEEYVMEQTELTEPTPIEYPSGDIFRKSLAGTKAESLEKSLADSMLASLETGKGALTDLVYHGSYEDSDGVWKSIYSTMDPEQAAALTKAVCFGGEGEIGGAWGVAEVVGKVKDAGRVVTFFADARRAEGLAKSCGIAASGGVAPRKELVTA